MITKELISDRQIEIIEAAGKILTRSGVGGLTIKNLAKEMHFSESAIYRHFTSKEEIIIAMLELSWQMIWMMRYTAGDQ
jgi:TetR/AcrR family fatty acid metabolism transcriptional regulator